MTRCSFRSDSLDPTRCGRLLLAGAAAFVLGALPLTISPDAPALQWQSALAKGGPGGDGPGGGNGGGNGGGGGPAAGGPGNGPGAHGRGIANRGRGHGAVDHPGSNGRGHAVGQGGYHDTREFLDSVRSGRAFGLERRDERVAAARERYEGALHDRGRHGGRGLGRDDVGRVAHQFSPEETRALANRGWKGPAVAEDGFRNHGQRVSTMVELAKQLGYGAHVGALQANFGTPYENDIAALQEQLEEAEAAGDEAEVERLEGELAEAIANAKPGVGPEDSWATADLDVNDDQVVDQRDLDALEEMDADAGTDEEQPGG